MTAQPVRHAASRPRARLAALLLLPALLGAVAADADLALHLHHDETAALYDEGHLWLGPLALAGTAPGPLEPPGPAGLAPALDALPLPPEPVAATVPARDPAPRAPPSA